jgi:Flp pilus assembly protein TadD
MPALPDALAREVAKTRSRPKSATHPVARDYFQQGIASLQHGRPAEAESFFREALRHNPDDPDTLNNLGNAIWHQGRSSEATAYFLRGYQFNQNDYGLLNNLGIVLWEQNRPRTGDRLLSPRSEAQARLV